MDVPNGVNPGTKSVTHTEISKDHRVPRWESQGFKGRTREFDLLDQLQSLVLGRNVVSFNSVVHEPDLDTVLIEQRGGISDSREDTGSASVD